ncbi:BgTH12-06915 [Blumeria graminis f. sp. triticale]|nr:BgTH12-06915 [Blumeria graminis f. sp. triticale]VDB94603.1 Bgt-119 [Blumeria graminis f. sp. tritici]
MHHQSHKSTSHFSSLPVGNLKNAAKRTAFGDVSNTAANAAKVQADGCLEKKVRERGNHQVPQKK